MELKVVEGESRSLIGRGQENEAVHKDTAGNTVAYMTGGGP